MVASNGLIRKPGDLEVLTSVEGHHKFNINPLLQPGENGSLHLMVNFNEIAPGGSAEPHYHTDCEVFDHVHYIISGDLIVSIAGKEQRVGPETLIYCRSDEVHSIRNVGSDTAKVLLISGLSIGGTGGKLVILT